MNNPHPMTTMQKIIDKLASKELSFGCVVTFGSDVKKKLLNKDSEGFWSCMLPNGVIVDCKEKYFEKILGHPVYIGDVLEKVWKNEGEKISFEDVQKNIKKLLYLWSACKFTRSLQEIEECGYEEVQCGKCSPPTEHGECNGVVQILKKSNAQALAEFINSII